MLWSLLLLCGAPPVIAALVRGMYNLYLHPLSKYPGPKAAAATRFWKAWVEIVQGASMCHVLPRIHAKYGPVVRIGPNELHFADPRAYLEIYNSKNKWDKDPRLYRSFRSDEASFGFLKYSDAKERRSILAPSFSTQAVAQCEPIINGKVEEFCEVLMGKDKDESIDLSYGLRSITMDIITYLTFGVSLGALYAQDFQAPLLGAIDNNRNNALLTRHSDTYKRLTSSLPPWMLMKFNPALRGTLGLKKIVAAQINNLMQNPKEGLEDLPHNMTVFNRMLDPEITKGRLPSRKALAEESQALTIAGSDTVGSTVLLGSFYLMKNLDTLAKLKEELRQVWPSLNQLCPDLHKLESLPYLNAVIKESLRMSQGVPSSLLRVVPPEGAMILDEAVPGGTVVSTICTFVHNNPTIFESPHKFRPERWLETPNLDEWLVPFSRGPRACFGINLAWAELRIIFAQTIRKFDMTLAGYYPDKLEYRGIFATSYVGPHIRVHVQPAQH